MNSASTSWLSSGALSRALADRGIRLTAPALQRYAREGRLPAQVTPGGHYRFDLASVLNVLDPSPTAPQTAAGSAIEDLIATRRDDMLRIIHRHNGTAAFIFGSVARGEAGPTSDIDVLVDFSSASSLFDVMHIEDELTELLGRPVDVVSKGALKPRDEAILGEAIPL